MIFFNRFSLTLISNTWTGLIKLRNLNGTTYRFQVLYTKARASGVRKSPEFKTLLRMERAVLVLLLLLWHPRHRHTIHYQCHNSGSIRFSIMLSQQCVLSFLPCPYYGQLLIYRMSKVSIGRQTLVRLQRFKLAHLLDLPLGLDCPGMVLYHRTDGPALLGTCSWALHKAYQTPGSRRDVS